MSRTGDVIENPVTGETITFLRTSEHTGGALLEIELLLARTRSCPLRTSIPRRRRRSPSWRARCDSPAARTSTSFDRAARW